MALKFKPLSEGLGFHPFSNGLPYTPAQPKRENPKPQTSQPLPKMGSGAVAAGRASFVFPESAKQPQTIVAKTLMIEPELGWDYLGRRFFAFALDSFINIVLGSLTLVGSLWSQKISLDFFLSPGVLSLTLCFLVFFNWCLITAQEVALGTSIGKKVFGLSIQGTAMATLLRAILFVPSSALLGLGVLWSVVDPERRAFHDLLSGIQPKEN